MTSGGVLFHGGNALDLDFRPSAHECRDDHRRPGRRLLREGSAVGGVHAAEILEVDEKDRALGTVSIVPPPASTTAFTFSSAFFGLTADRRVWICASAPVGPDAKIRLPTLIPGESVAEARWPVGTICVRCAAASDGIERDGGEKESFPKHGDHGVAG